MLLLLQPLWVTILSWVQAKENKDDRSAQAVRDEASLSPAATRTGFSRAPRPQVGNVHSSHGVAATIRPPEVGLIIRISPRGKGPFRGNNLECGVLQDLLTSLVAVSRLLSILFLFLFFLLIFLAKHRR